jgi:radical SAM protein with 4Fe4S-binding SPASM domain
LFCAHCRASADSSSYDELSTAEGLHLVDEITEIGKPIIILTGGEPLLRHDLFQIAQYAVDKGLRVVIGTNGTLITEDIAARLKEIPISRIGVSLDFPGPGLQDKFRGQAGAFEAAMAGIARAREANIEVQINSTITRLNTPYLNELVNLALQVGAVAFHPFLLVPTGRGKGLQSVQLSPKEYERILNWFYDKQIELADKIFFKPTDAPQYQRIVRCKKGEPQKVAATDTNYLTRGCLAGTGFCFISHQGRVQGCGYLDVEAGNIRKETFKEIWAGSPLFIELRDLSNIKGRCGICQYKKICGGCRARAYEVSGDYLEAEPYCFYEPVML